jgi:colanic acid/amylovoran biosynthesis protein
MASIRVCLFGSSTDTGNLGVSALCVSTLDALATHLPQASLTLFDEDWGLRRDVIETRQGQFGFDRFGARYSRRLHRPESMWNLRLSSRLGGLGNPGARAILHSNAVLDISGGDSFTDLYGARRFNSVVIPKLIALEHNVPLVLLPQTYGPFESPRMRKIAERVVRDSALAYARDPDSFRMLRELADDAFDPERHRSGVDVAFALEARAPHAALPPHLKQWLQHRATPLIGINVSGLILNDPEMARARFGIKCNYGDVIISSISSLLRESDCNVVLIPHVITPADHFESDIRACASIAQQLGGHVSDRVAVCPPLDDPREVKGIIGKLDWFCGTRMHSAIAALSSGVPTAALAYSGKTRGVFDTCAQADHVFDLRELTTERAVEQIRWSWRVRNAAARALSDALPTVVQQAELQMSQIADVCQQPVG